MSKRRDIDPPKPREIDPYKPRSSSAKLDVGLDEAEVARACMHVYLNRFDNGQDVLNMIARDGWAKVQQRAMSYSALVKLALEAARDPRMGLEETVKPYLPAPAAALTDQEIEEMLS